MEKKYGVYICKGCEIADTVEIEKLEEVATKEKQIPVCKTHDALCSPEGLDLIKNDISGEGVNTVVVAACSPRVKYKEFSFNGSIVERINLREFVAWTQEPKTEDTQSLAEDYMRMGITKAQHTGLPEPFMLEEIDKAVLVIGGGITGMTSALGAADAGYNVILVEKQAELGGWAAKMHKQLPRTYPFESIEEPTIKATIDKVTSHSNIKVYTSSEIEKIAGFPGQYDVSIKTNGGTEQAKAGSVIMAAGWRPYDANKLEHLGYGANPNVITNVQMEE
ncbi:MAG TPA: CoB--CoM heterodisulfide reductase iron-sulfur subunit A family protein, partial [Nitrospirae bacterium]|nr:CoB--CoM heterodisulfide reductase iron-sulfur subunit A family protein [Nitrospirota bacterium]